MARVGAGDFFFFWSEDRGGGLFLILGFEEVKGWEDEFGPLDLSCRKSQKV